MSGAHPERAPTGAPPARSARIDRSPRGARLPDRFVAPAPARRARASRERGEHLRGERHGHLSCGFRAFEGAARRWGAEPSDSVCCRGTSVRAFIPDGIAAPVRLGSSHVAFGTLRRVPLQFEFVTVTPYRESVKNDAKVFSRMNCQKTADKSSIKRLAVGKKRRALRPLDALCEPPDTGGHATHERLAAVSRGSRALGRASHRRARL